MIINCPVYLEVDGKFTPQEGRELSLGVRKFLVDAILKDTKGSINAVWTRNDGSGNTTLKFKVLSESEALARFGKSVSKAKSQASDGEPK